MKKLILSAVFLLSAAACANEDEDLKPGDVFKDCDTCPELVVIPSGAFAMGAREYDESARPREKPKKFVSVSEQFALGRYEVTLEQYRRCVEAGGCAKMPRRQAWQQDNMPISWLWWKQAKEYTLWLSQLTGKKYSLPSEGEWEYAARAGTSTIYWWGDELGVGNTNCLGCQGQVISNYSVMTPVGSYKSNPFGLFDMLGNASEWVEDCYQNSLDSVTLEGGSGDQATCRWRVAKGGSYLSQGHKQVRISSRQAIREKYTQKFHGFRVKRTLR